MVADRVEMYVPESKFLEMKAGVSCGSIANEKGSCKTVMWLNKEYVITGGVSRAHELGSMWGHLVENYKTYSGKLKPLTYHEHNREVDAGRRERDYNGMLLRNGSRQLVAVGPQVTFLPVPVGQQLNLF